MTKILIAGLATIVIAGTVLVGTGMYAASTSSSGTWIQGKFRSHMGQGSHENLVATLSWRVSTEDLTAIQSLMTKHKTEMDALRSSSGTTIDKATMDAQHTAFKTEMGALIAKYPELKTTLPQIWGKMGRGNREFEAIIVSLPTSTQTIIKSIRDEYKTKQDTLRTEEKAKIDTILSQYPEVKRKIDVLKANGSQWMEGKGWHGGRNGGQRGMMNNSTTAN